MSENEGGFFSRWSQRKQAVKLGLAEEEKAQEKEEKKRPAKKEETFFDNPTVKQVGRTAASIITRSLLGALGLGGRTTRKKKTGWF